jgi:hypothetical protein
MYIVRYDSIFRNSFRRGLHGCTGRQEESLVDPRDQALGPPNVHSVILPQSLV